MAALCLSSSSIISRCCPREEMLLEATAAAGSCVLASSLMELKHTMGWDFFFPFFLSFLNISSLLEGFWQQRGSSYVSQNSSHCLHINSSLNPTIYKCNTDERGVETPKAPHRAYGSLATAKEPRLSRLLTRERCTWPRPLRNPGRSCGIARLFGIPCAK